MKPKQEFEAFVKLADELISVSHAEVKAKLEEEKKKKALKKKGNPERLIRGKWRSANVSA